MQPTGCERFGGAAGLQMNFSVVPLPASAWLLLTGLAGVAALRARRRRG
ncbi:MAG: VPLPA-CTERM sorting domain-containing protein [Gammaproteobacteria bacterium]|nr:VPLPA-CTERM sorting domain-containing protein [Gammaproteobacteria bacterium]